MVNVMDQIVVLVHSVCPTNVFVIKENRICANSPQYCKLCYKCLEICPTVALNLKKLEGECI
jgi:NAD-dependent dihydropyrimidine dehydrogenase PreA subunit